MRTHDIMAVARALGKSAEKLEAILNKTDNEEEREELSDLIAEVHSAYRTFLYADWN